MNNAGCYPTEFILTEDKIDSCLQVNHLSHMYLTYLLLDYFDKAEGRIINVASRGHIVCDFTEESIKQLYEDKDFTSYKKYYRNILIDKHTLYGNTKMANVYFASFLAELCEAKYPHIKAFSLHPGLVATDFFRFIDEHRLKYLYKLLTRLVWFFSKTIKVGAQTQLDLCYRDINELENGGYFQNCGLSTTNRLGKNKKIRDLFIDYSCYVIRNTGRKIEF
jgi:NAD(P)-dependent dehydrogenase (short-subunit alcohol dehydrogenase family)